jgi:hypothetical protein
MRLGGRFSQLGGAVTAAVLMLAGAAGCAAAGSSAVPPSAATMSTAPASGYADGQPAFVTAGQAVAKSGRAATAPRTTAAKSTSAATSATGASSTGGASITSGSALTAGNPNGHAAVPAAGLAVDTSQPDHVIGTGSPAGCTSAAVVQAVAEGGIITFDCGPAPVTITMTATAKVVNTSQQVVLDGGGKVTLSGGGNTRILYMNTCDAAQTITTDDCWEQQSPRLVVQNLTFTDAYSATPQPAPGGPSIAQSSATSYGGGAIFDQGGQLKVVNSDFTGNQCLASGQDLGGAAIRAYGMDLQVPVYITNDTFTGNSCANGGALSGLYANFAVYNSLLTGNKANGFGGNPAASGTAGGGSGGAIYTDGNGYNLLIDGSVVSDNSAREGGGAIFYVVDADGGTLSITNSTLSGNPSGVFQNAPGIFDDVNGAEATPTESGSSVS